jgi:cysteinyl-tRNA synthetase
MVEKHLPDGADIHGGGTDLRFPHHENELAQSAGAHPDHPFVRAWAHHGMVTLASDKMAKSLGNILDVKRAVKLHGRNAIRMWLLQSHYSQPIDYSEEILEEKREAYEHLMNLYRQISASERSSEFSDKLAAELRERFDAAMQNDLNTPEAIAAVFDVTGRAGQEISTRLEAAEEFASLSEALREVLTIFGFNIEEEAEDDVDGIRLRYPAWLDQATMNELVTQYVSLRRDARSERNWELADQIREEMRTRGWDIEDNPKYTRIYPAKPR